MQDSDLKKLLTEKLSFTQNSAEVYLFLLKYNSATLNEIIKNTNIPRTTVHNILQDFDQRGIITIIRSKKEKQYVVEEPSQLIGILKKEYEEKKVAAQKFVSGFKSKRLNIKYYYGALGVIEHRKNLFKTTDDVIEIFNNDLVQEHLEKNINFKGLREKEPRAKFNLEYLCFSNKYPFKLKDTKNKKQNRTYK